MASSCLAELHVPTVRADADVVFARVHPQAAGGRAIVVAAFRPRVGGGGIGVAGTHWDPDVASGLRTRVRGTRAVRARVGRTHSRGLPTVWGGCSRVWHPTLLHAKN